MSEDDITKSVLEACIKTIIYKSFEQLDQELAPVYADAIANRFGYVIERPYITVRKINDD